MTRCASVALVSSLWFGVGLSAQQPGQSSLHASLDRETTRLASAFANDDPFPDRSTGFNTLQAGRSDDWGAVRRLPDGTGVLVTTRQDRRINGKLAVASEDALQMTVRWGRTQTLRRDEIREVRLRHRLSVGQYAGLGLLLGGVTGALVEAPCSDCPVHGAISFGATWGGIGGYVMGEAVHARPGRLVYTLAKP